MRRVITVAREHGSGGGEIARRVADKLGWRMIDRLLLEEVARLARVPPREIATFDERVDPWVIRLAKGLWAGSPDSFASGARNAIFDADRMAELSRKVILDAAEAGECVIIGRGAQCILGSREDTLRVFVYAPLADRLERLRSRGVSETDAAAEIEWVDRNRFVYVRHYHHCDRTSPECYDLMVNSHLGVEPTARMILCAAGCGEEVD